MTVIKSKIATQQMRRKNLEAIKYRLPHDSTSSHEQFRSRGFLKNVRFLQALLCFDHLENGANKKRSYEKGVEEEDWAEFLLYKSFSRTLSPTGSAQINRMIAKKLLKLNVGDTPQSSRNVEVLSKKFAVAQLRLYCDIFKHTHYPEN